MSNYASPETIQLYTDRFSEQISHVDPCTFRQLPDFTQHINHTGRPTVIDFEPEQTVLIDYEAAGIDTSTIITGLKFGLKPGNRIGREDSHRVVLQGDIYVMNESSDTGVTKEVAVKPGYENRGSLRDSLGEVAMFQYMGQLDLPTLKSFAIHVEDTGMNHIITSYRSDVKTLDSVEWKKLTPEDMWEQVKIAINGIALMHSNLLVHNDFYFKNVGFDDTGMPVIVDPESMTSVRELPELLHGAEPRSMDQTEKRVFDGLVRLLNKDFSDLSTSIQKYVLPQIYNKKKMPDSKKKFKLYKKHLYVPYGIALEQNLESINSPHRAILSAAFDSMVSLNKDWAIEGVL